MKKFLLLLMLFIPFGVFAENTCEFVKNSDTSNNRVLTCDKELNTTTTFKTEEDIVVLNNDVCKVTCSEELIFMVDPIKKVLAGTSFNYPLYTSGVRKCSASYNYDNYELIIKTLVNEYASLTGSAKTTKKNEIDNYYAQKKACDEFGTKESDYQNKYEMGGDVKLDVQTSTKVDTLSYVYKDISEYTSIINYDKIKYSGCKFNESNYTCTGEDTTILGWIETAKIFGKYTMPNSYVEKYTGVVSSTKTDTTCNANDRYFTDFKELTNPVAGDIENNGYKLTLYVKDKDLGNNLSSTNPRWNLTVNCWYQVKNLSYPQGGNTSSETNTDENYDKYGNTAFVYREIDLSNPFPERDPGANWFGKTNLITNNRNIEFEISLNKSKINKVKEYNENNAYDTFNLNEMEKSLFIINNPSIVDRKK